MMINKNEHLNLNMRKKYTSELSIEGDHQSQKSEYKCFQDDHNFVE